MELFTTAKLSEHITHIRETSGVSCFLVCGQERAVLIDTCAGVRGLKETVKALTDKPVTVLLTHSHGDHSGGAADFDSVWIHPADLRFMRGEAAGAGGLDMRIGYVNRQNDAGVLFTAEDMVPDPPHDKDYGFLEDGMVFDLGGFHVEVIHVPGHTAGSCTFLFAEERSMLYGDALNSNTLLYCSESVPVSVYKKGLEHLKTYEDRYDTAYYSHGPAEGPKSCLEDNLDLCEKILKREDDAIEVTGMGGRKALMAAAREGFARKDGRWGNILYDIDRIG